MSNPRQRRFNVAALGVLLASMACSRDASYRGRSADELAHSLRTGSPTERLGAAQAFTVAPPHELSHVRPLLLALADSDSSVRAVAMSATHTLPEDASDALVVALRDSNAIVRRGAALALGHLYKDTKTPIKALRDATYDPDDSVRTLAVLSLGQRSAGAWDAVDRIRELATTPGPQRAAALMVLPNIDTESRSLLGYYTPALNDTSAKVRAAAAWAILGAAGTQSESAVTLLAAALKDPDISVRLTALRSLGIVADHDSVAMQGIQSMREARDTAIRRVADSLAHSVRVP